MDLQKIFDAMSDQMAKERSESQVTLGEMIMTLKNFPQDTEVVGVSAECDSYRGYYSDLAFEPGNTTVGKLLEVAESALGKTFERYKGGDFTMNKITPTWCANYGSCGQKIVSLIYEGEKVIAGLEDDDD